MANPKFKIKHSITKKEWNKTHKDFKSIIDGIHYVMKLTDKGTALVPVKIVESEIEEGIASTIDQIRQDSNDIRDFLKKVFSDSDFRDMKNDKDFLKYLKSIYEGVELESVNEAYIVTYAKKKGEKPVSAAFQLRGSALSFERDLKKDGYITMVTQKKVKGIDESVNESKEEVNPQQLSKIQSDIRKINSKIKVYISKHPITKGELSIELGAGHDDDSEIQKIYKVLKKHTGDWRTGTMFNESVNENNSYSITDDKGRPFLLIVGEEPKDSKGKSEYKKDGFYISPQKGFKGLITAYFKDEKTLKKNIDKKYHNQLGESVNEASSEPQIITQLRDVLKNGYKTLKDPKSGKRMKVDTYSASAIVGVYDKLNPSNKEKFVKQGLLGMQSLAFKFIK